MDNAAMQAVKHHPRLVRERLEGVTTERRNEGYLRAIRLNWFAAALALLVSCQKPAEPRPPMIRVVTESTRAELARGVALRQHVDRPDLAIYIDARAFRRGMFAPFGDSLLALLQAVDVPAVKAKQRCKKDPIAHIDEAFLTQTDLNASTKTFVFSFVSKDHAKDIFHCLRGWYGPFAPNEEAAGTRWRNDAGHTLVGVPGRVVFGTTHAVERSLAGGTELGPELQASLDRNDGAFVLGFSRMSLHDHEAWTFGLGENEGRTRAFFEVASNLDLEETRARLAAKPALGTLLPKPLLAFEPVLRGAYQEATVKVRRGVLSLRVDLGTPRSAFASTLSRLAEQQPAFLQNFTGEQSDSRREALDDLEQLALQLRTYMTERSERDNHSYGLPDHFVEAKRLPASVPRGTSTLLDAKEWFANEGFRDYAFAKNETQRCSYSVQPTADGREAAVVAECDEDGDGIVARYALRVWVDDGPDWRSISRSPFATELNPHE